MPASKGRGVFHTFVLKSAKVDTADQLGGPMMHGVWKRWAGALLLLAVASGSPVFFAQAQTPARVTAFDQTFDLRDAIAKMNAYVKLANGTTRATEAWERYKSWVNITTGPTGRERIVYGIYSVHDATSLIKDAQDVRDWAPKWPALEKAAVRLSETYVSFASVANEAEAYYERKDHVADKFAGGRALHPKLTAAAQAYLDARAVFETELAAVSKEIDRLDLAAIEAREGKAATWHVRRLMIEARDLSEGFPSDQKPIVGLPAFDAATQRFVDVQRDLEKAAAANTELSAIAGRSRSFVASLRELRVELGKVKGDSRRASREANHVIQEYNVLVDVANSTLEALR
jgi:hypothetical protein